MQVVEAVTSATAATFFQDREFDVEILGYYLVAASLMIEVLNPPFLGMKRPMLALL